MKSSLKILLILLLSCAAKAQQDSVSSNKTIYLGCGGVSGSMIINGQGRGCINLANGQFHFLAGMGAGISFGASAHATVLIFRGDDSEGISGTYCGGRVDFAEAQYGANLNIYKRVKGKSGFLYGMGWSGGASTSLSVDCININ